MSFLDKTGLARLWANIIALADTKVPVSRKINEKELLEDVTLTASDVGAASSTHDHNDVYYTEAEIDTKLEGKAASSHGAHVSYSSTAPVMDGTASVGSASTVARSDHKHPTDTSRASKSEFDTHDDDSTRHITSTERTNWNAAKTTADAAKSAADSKLATSTFNTTIANYYTKTEINNMEFIAVNDIDTIVGNAAEPTVTFNNGKLSIS